MLFTDTCHAQKRSTTRPDILSTSDTAASVKAISWILNLRSLEPFGYEGSTRKDVIFKQYFTYLSMFKIFTKSPQPKNTTQPISPSTGRIQQRGRIRFSSTYLGDIYSHIQENSTSGSAESQSTDDTTTDSMASVNPAQDLKVDPHSEAMQYLGFRFDIATGMWYPFYRPSNLLLSLQDIAHVKINPQMRSCLPQDFGQSLPGLDPLTSGAIQCTTNQGIKVTHLSPWLPAILLCHQKSTPARRTK